VKLSSIGTIALLLPLASLASPGCQRADEPKVDAPSKSQPKPEPTPGEVEPEPTPEPTPIATPAIIYFVGSALWQVDAAGGQPRALGFEVSPDNPGMDETIGEGDSTPTISRDGRWLAWADKIDLWVTELGPSDLRNHPITKMPAQVDDWIKAASISFSTWSPDSSTLIVHLGEPGYMDEVPLPLPAGVSYGFHVLRTADLGLVHAPQIEAVEGWTPDSKAVIGGSLHVAKNDSKLLQFPVDPGPARPLRQTAESYGFSQVQINGEWLTWTSHEHGAQIVVAPLGGGDPKPMSPTAGYAEIQRPAVAPDGAHVIFDWNRQHHLGAGPDASAAKPLPGIKQVQWFDAGHLLAVTGDGLVLLDLDGKAKVLDPAATGFVRY
jgi:hypothetical protein